MTSSECDCRCALCRTGSPCPSCHGIGERGNGHPVRVIVDPSDPATIERAAMVIADCYANATDPFDAAAAVLASLTDTGDNKEQTNG